MDRIRHDDTSPRTRFERLYDRHYVAVLAYALRRSDVIAAQDVAAETFLVAWRRLDDVPAEARPWLLAVAGRVLANERRGGGRRDALAARLRTFTRQHDDEAPEGGVLTDALLGLSERDREALMLVAWDGLTTAHAAQVLGCSPVAMRVRLHRARRRLGHALKEIEPSDRTSMTSDRAEEAMT